MHYKTGSQLFEMELRMSGSNLFHALMSSGIRKVLKYSYPQETL